MSEQRKDFRDLMYPNPVKFIETFNGVMNRPPEDDLPFNGAFGVDQKWPDPLNTDKPKKGRKKYQVAARVEPVGDIGEFGFLFAANLGTTMKNLPRDGDVSMFICYDVVGKDAHQAMSYASFKISRAIRKTRFPIARLTFDIREVS